MTEISAVPRNSKMSVELGFQLLENHKCFCAAFVEPGISLSYFINVNLVSGIVTKKALNWNDIT